MFRGILIPRSLKYRFLLLLAVLSLAASAVIVLSGLENRQSEIEGAESKAVLLVQSLAGQQQQIAIGIKQMLGTLAELPQVQNLDAQACNELFSQLIARYPYYSTISAATPDGNMFANATPFRPGSVNLSDRKHIRDAIQTLDFSAGEYIIGRASKVQSINYTYPVLDRDKNLRAIVIAGFKLDEYARFLERANLPEGSALVIADHRGVRLFRLPQNEATAPGRPIPEDSMETISGEQDQGLYERTGEDGITRIYAFKQLRLRQDLPPYLYVLVGIPKDTIIHKANAEMLSDLGLLGTSAFITMFLAWLFGNMMLVEPIKQLVIAASRFGSGELGTRTGLPHTADEVGQLARSFDDMASLLEERSLERQIAEEQRRHSEEQYSRLFESLIDVFYRTDASGTITMISPSITRAAGYLPEEIIGAQIRDLYLFPEERDELLALILAEGFVENFESRFRRKDGSALWVSVNATLRRDPAGNVLGIDGMARDITYRKLAEEELRKLSRAVEQSPVSIVITDLNGTIEYVNPKFSQVTGYTREEALGQNPRILKSGETLPEEYEELWKTITAGREWHGEFHNKKKSGAFFWEQASISPVRDAQGVVRHFVAVKEDITERKQAEEELRRSKVALEQMNEQLELAIERANAMAVAAEMANAAKSQFLANMSHEIRTPMNGVIGMSGLLLDTELTAEQRHYAQTVRNSGESLLSLINDILDFSKIEAKKLELERLDFDLTSLLDDFASMLAVRAHEKGIELLCATDPQVPVLLRGDPGRLRQVLTNLAGNALKFTRRGEVSVRVARVEETDRDVLLRFTVHDTGIGIPVEKIGALFDKFSQLDASTTRQYGGTGLGLAISKQLVRMMGGEIGVKSQEAKGSEFWFTVRLGKQAEEAGIRSPQLPELCGIRVLIVDDNATNREILSHRLAFWGMRPAEARDGPAALHALCRALDENDPFRVALIDMQMPAMDGEALGRAILADSRLADTRLVMLTSPGTPSGPRRFAEIGFASQAAKPIRYPELGNILARLLAQQTGKETTAQHNTACPAARENLNPFEGRRVRILLAEDNLVNQQVALGLLKKLGLCADVVASGVEALKALETARYDLILMDVQMPEMDGLEATRRIRKAERARPNGAASPPRHIPMIAMTAHAMQGDLERSLEAGMDDYLSKPVRLQGLAKVLEKWLPREKEEPAKRTDALFDEDAGTSSSDAPSFASIFDWEDLMVRLMNDEDLAGMVIKGFLEDMPGQIAALKSTLEAGDASRLELQAHTIKGASANVCGEALRAVAYEIEKSGERGDLEAARVRIPELERRFAELKAAIEQHFGPLRMT